MGEDLKHWVRVPVGPDAARWATRGRCRRVLLVVHNVTAATRLIDVLPLFRDDLRIQVLATCTGSSPFQSGVAELLASVGVPVLPWEQALSTPADLAISASFGGQLDQLKGTLTVLSHGEYRVAAVLHPNIWHGHGPGQIRLWLDRARRAGLALVDPLEGWRQALIAADVVLGDFGSVSYYAAACGTPVLLGAADPEALGTESPVAAFVRSAPRLDPYRALPPQLDRLLSEHRPANGPTELTSSAPGESAALLRGLFYRLIGVTEPAAPAVLDPLPLPPYEPPLRTAPLLVHTRTAADGTVAVRRYAEPRHEPDDAGAEGAGAEGEAGSHLAVHEDTLDPGVLESADIVLRYGEADDPRFGSPGEWAAEVLDRYRSASLAAYITGPRECEVLHRGGLRCRLTSDSAGDPAVHASALLARLHSGPAAVAPAPTTLTVATGTHLARVRITVDREGTGRAARPGR
ncbi:hypothetical protein [Kitasatospora purpeofusca]|uniref:hypothetical protein n=1 Tax=Kitasatospora purpeofusca TaxID=67352 RepID=UPI003815D9F5